MDDDALQSDMKVGALDDAVLSDDQTPKDYFQNIDGERFAGRHLLVELWGAKDLNDPDAIAAHLRSAATDADATILHDHFHHFSPFGGVSGVLVLAESHISIHTWPERSYAAIDIFMCGACNPHHSLPALKKGFEAERFEVLEQRRGVLR